MTRRRNLEADVVEYFQTAPPPTAAALFRVVKSILDTRGVFKAPKMEAPRRNSTPVSAETTTSPKA